MVTVSEIQNKIFLKRRKFKKTEIYIPISPVSRQDTYKTYLIRISQRTKPPLTTGKN